MSRPIQIKKETILKVAKEMFFERGMTGTEMKEIAAACNIGRSSLYRYFESKEAIALELVIEILDDLNSEMEEIISQYSTGYEKVEQGLIFYIQKMKKSASMVRFLDDFDSCFYYGYPLNLSQEYIQKLKTHHYALTNALKQASEEGSIGLIRNAEYTAKFLINTLFGVGQRIIPRADLIREEQGYAEEYLEDLLIILKDCIKSIK